MREGNSKGTGITRRKDRQGKEVGKESALKEARSERRRDRQADSQGYIFGVNFKLEVSVSQLVDRGGKGERGR